MRRFNRLGLLLLCSQFVCCFIQITSAQERFSQLVGPIQAKPYQGSGPVPIPFITWGGDVATFQANGGLATANGSTYNQLGIQMRLTPGDDFVGQVRDYVSGKTPFLRGTMRMLGQASEVLSKTPGTKPVVILQLSWSAGDHIVARQQYGSLNDLKPKNGKKIKIACQQGGPHVGLLYDSLDAARINRNDVEIVWVSDLTGPKGPADKFRNDPSVDACCVITPDMIGLTGGMEEVGSGAEGTVQGAKVLNSTAQMSRSIADVYAVRQDWYQQNKPFVQKFVAGYLKGTEATVAMRKKFEETQRLSPEYRGLLTKAQQIFGAEVLPTLEIDAHGLLLDCSFVGLPGQIAFFNDPGNLNGFEPKMKKALDLATGWGYAQTRNGFVSGGFDYQQLAKISGIKYEAPSKTGGRIAESFDFSPDAELDDQTIVSFTISFEPNQSEFPAAQYGAEFRRAVEAASTFGNAVVVIRGHSDPTKTLRELMQAGMKKGLIKQQGRPGSYRYFLKGRPLDIKSVETIQKLIKSGDFEGVGKYKPRETMQAATNLSQARAQAVKRSLTTYAKQQNLNLDTTQMQPVGAGILEPIIPKPRNLKEAKENMRVEFRIVRVPAEAIEASDFDF